MFLQVDIVVGAIDDHPPRLGGVEFPAISVPLYKLLVVPEPGSGARSVDLVAIPVGGIQGWGAPETNDRALPRDVAATLGQLSQDFLEEIPLDTPVSVTPSGVLPQTEQYFNRISFLHLLYSWRTGWGYRTKSPRI